MVKLLKKKKNVIDWSVISDSSSLKRGRFYERRLAGLICLRGNRIPEWPTGSPAAAWGPAALNEERELHKTAGRPEQDHNSACVGSLRWKKTHTSTKQQTLPVFKSSFTVLWLSIECLSTDKLTKVTSVAVLESGLGFIWISILSSLFFFFFFL